MFIGIVLGLDIQKLYLKLKQFKGFKHFHSTNKPEELPQPQPVSNTNKHMLIYGTSGSGKTSFLKYYLNQTKSIFIVIGRDETELNYDRGVPLLQLEKFDIESLANITIILDDAAAYKNLKKKSRRLILVW